MPIVPVTSDSKIDNDYASLGFVEDNTPKEGNDFEKELLSIGFIEDTSKPVHTWEDIKPSIPDTLLPDYEKRIKNALTISATFDMDLPSAYELHDTFTDKLKEPNLYDKATGSFKAGIGDVYSNLGNALKWAGADEEIANNYIDYGNKLRLAYIPPKDISEFSWRSLKDPEYLATNLTRAVPFTLSLIPVSIIGAYLGAGTGAAIGLGTAGRFILASLGGAFLSRPIEAAFEAGNTFEEAIKRGLSEDEANKSASEVFRGNLKLAGLDYLEIALAFAPLKFGKAIKPTLRKRIVASAGKLAGVGLMEAGEERYQEYIAMQALGDEVNFFDINNPRLNESTTIGGIFGAGMGGVGSVWDALHGEITKTMPEDIKKKYEDSKKKYTDNGANKEQSEIKALDDIAETKEGQEHIKTVIDSLKNGELPSYHTPDIQGQPVEAAPAQDIDTSIDKLIKEQDITEDNISRLFEGQPIETEMSKPDFKDLKVREIDEVKQHVDMSIMAANKGKLDIAKAEAEKAKANGEALKLVDGEEIDKLVDTDLSRIPSIEPEINKTLAEFKRRVKGLNEGSGRLPKISTQTNKTMSVQEWDKYLAYEDKPREDFRSESGSISLDQLVPQSLESLAKITKIGDAIPHLENIGKSVYKAGMKFNDFINRMKDSLGNLWDKFKHLIRQVYGAVKAWNKSLGETGGIGRGDKEIKENEIKKEFAKSAKIAKELYELGDTTGVEREKVKMKELHNQYNQQKQRKFLKTIAESLNTNPELAKKVSEIDPQEYTVQPNAESLKMAEDRISKSKEDAEKYVLGDSPFSAEKGATFISLIGDAQKEGSYDKAVELIGEYDKQLREAGRFVQAASIWNVLTPEGFLRAMQTYINRVNAKKNILDRFFGGEKIELTKEEKIDIIKEKMKINEMPDGIDKTNATLLLIDRVAKKFPPTTSELFDAFRYQNMLSGWQTQERNIFGNTLNMIFSRPYIMATRGMVDYFESSIFGKERDVYIKNIPIYYKHMINAVPNAIDVFISVWKGQTDILKPEIGVDVKGAFEKARAKNMPKYLTIIQRFMEATDRFNQHIMVSAEYAVNLKNGLSPEESQKIAEINSQKYLYRNKYEINDKSLSLMSKVLVEVQDLIIGGRHKPVIGFPLKILVPFIQTPMNIGIQMIEHSPLALARRSGFNQESRAKILAGSIIMAIGGIMAMMGQTTWTAPSDKKEKEFFYASGRKPFSVNINGSWIPIWYLGPFAMSFLLPTAYKYYFADQRKALTKNQTEKSIDIIFGVARFIGSQTSTQSIGAFFDLLSGNVDYSFPKQIGFTAEQLIPLSGLLRNTNKLIDPVYRNPDGFWEAIKKDMPFLSKEVTPYTTPFGEESKRDSFYTSLLPYEPSKEKEIYDLMYQQIAKEGQIKAIENDFNKKIEKGKITDKDIENFIRQLGEVYDK